MAGAHNLTRGQAAARAALLDVTAYDISLDLTGGGGGPGGSTFRSVTRIEFACREPGAATFVEAAADTLRAATLNDVPLSLADWSAEGGLPLTSLAERNTLVVEGDFRYSTSGQGLHRSVDPVDGEVYLYSQFAMNDAQRAYACFDQPDLKSVYTWHVRVPAHWKVVSNAQVASVTTGPAGERVVDFEPSVRMSTYITALCAGPYHEVRTTHDGIDLGLFARSSMKEYLDADDLFLITKQGFDFYHARFGVRYPLPKYDQLWVPDFNLGAMENFGAVTHAEAAFLFRSRVTDAEYEWRATVILHEMAHMWFGNLVTTTWWDDLWLNESFADWAGYWSTSGATRFPDAWTTFLSSRKNWGYLQDQLSTTHPVYPDVPDVEAARTNIDGITYAKGASVIKQLVAFVGLEPFLAGLREHFSAHAWGNATFDDLVAALERSSGRDLRTFATQWLRAAQVNTLRPEVVIGADGAYEQVAVRQTAPADHPTLRSHRIGIGLYDRVGDRLARRTQVVVDVAGARTELPALAGVPAADVLLLNDDDLTYAKIRLDDRSLAAVLRHVAGLESSLARGLVWNAAWDMVRDAELATRDFVEMVVAGLPGETDINLVTTNLRLVAQAVNEYADEPYRPTGWRRLADTAQATVAVSEPGSGRQLAWARAFAANASTADDRAVLRGWLEASSVPAGLAIDTELRWTLLRALVAGGAAGEAEIAAELARDATASGAREAAQARALVPTAAAKAAVWQRLTGGEELPNWEVRALVTGLHHPAQTELTAPFVERYFAVLDQVWGAWTSEPALEFAEMAYPRYHISVETVAVADAWLAAEHPAALRRLVAEGRDAVVRALAARAKDTPRGART